MPLNPKGKIGRLPKAFRDEVNLRLENGQKGPTLVAWLNSLPWELNLADPINPLIQ